MVGLDNVMSYVEKNLDGSIRVSKLAAIVRLSTAHFSRAFTKALGVTPAHYVRLRRLQAAMIMMRTTTEKLSVIAISSGHADQSHFTRVFSRFVGVSPRRWRIRASQNFVPPGVTWEIPDSGCGVSHRGLACRAWSKGREVERNS
jgi:AraC family transcriptional regulator